MDFIDYMQPLPLTFELTDQEKKKQPITQKINFMNESLSNIDHNASSSNKSSTYSSSQNPEKLNNCEKLIKSMKEAAFDSPKATFTNTKVLSLQNITLANQMKSNNFYSSSSSSVVSEKSDTISNQSEKVAHNPLCESDSSDQNYGPLSKGTKDIIQSIFLKMKQKQKSNQIKKNNLKMIDLLQSKLDNKIYPAHNVNKIEKFQSVQLSNGTQILSYEAPKEQIKAQTSVQKQQDIISSQLASQIINQQSQLHEKQKSILSKVLDNHFKEWQPSIPTVVNGQYQQQTLDNFTYSFGSQKSSDEMVDLSKYFGQKFNIEPLHSREYLRSFQHFALRFDTEQKSDNLEIIEEDMSGGIVKCKSSLNSFKTVYSVEPLESGQRHYFEIKFLFGCNFKIGVSKNNTNFDVAFCDSQDGFGFYSAGQLRNGSKTTGAKYGKPFRGTKDQDVIGVYVDLIDGKIFFSKNGEIFEIAFQNQELKRGNFYAAVCCLTKDESFELLYPQPED